MTDELRSPLRVIGLFAGVGGIECGLAAAGHRTLLLNELDPAARAVLRARFADVQITADVRDLTELPDADLVAAGFPCTDISQAGRKSGITGSQSGLVDEVFRLLAAGHGDVPWLLLENVSYMLRLDRGRAMAHIVSRVEELGYRWAYRVVDARSFGLAQRRQRVLFLASREEDPRRVLFADDDGRETTYDDAIGAVDEDSVYGFYWTEGLRGLGWARNAVPTIKGGSGLGIPSPPAIWFPRSGVVGTPHVEDAETLQGFPRGWTNIAVEGAEIRTGLRWRQIGNAVSVPISTWVGRRLRTPGDPVGDTGIAIASGTPWPRAAYGYKGIVQRVDVSPHPLAKAFDLRNSLAHSVRPLSVKATDGFLSRAYRGRLRFADGFLQSLEKHRASRTGAA